MNGKYLPKSKDAQPGLLSKNLGFLHHEINDEFHSGQIEYHHLKEGSIVFTFALPL